MPEETRRSAHLDPRSPYVLDTRELGRRPGSMRRVSRSVPAPAHLGVDVLGVPEGSALELDLRLESVVEGVLVSGTVTTTVTGECVRCLDPVSRHLEVDVQELWTHQGRDTGRPAPAGEEGLVNSIADESQVDIWGNIYRQKLVDTARGQADGDKDSFFAQLNEQWGAAVSELAG